MKFHVTPELLEAAYTFLRATPPFNKWRLPQADDVEFHVIGTTNKFGDCQTIGDTHIIRASNSLIGCLRTLLETVAHEMVHAYCDRNGVKSDHGREFKRFAKQVCDFHGFDVKSF